MTFKKAATWTAIWVGLAMLFNVGILFFWPDQAIAPTKALEFLTGYMIELSLSMDNLFLFLMLFTCFCIKGEYQRRVLNYGIIGAIIMRLIFILVGVSLIKKFEWILIVFGAILVITSFKIIFGKEIEVDPDKNWAVKILRKFVPVTSELHGHKFFVRLNGILHATPLILVLVVIESTDLVFAIDSIPAVFSITTDPFIVYTSNIFAILGLRSMYFFLERIKQAFVYVKQGVGVILFITGLKMLLAIFHIKVPIPLALGLIVSVLTISIVASLLFGKKEIACDLPAGELTSSPTDFSANEIK